MRWIRKKKKRKLIKIQSKEEERKNRLDFETRSMRLSTKVNLWSRTIALPSLWKAKSTQSLVPLLDASWMSIAWTLGKESGGNWGGEGKGGVADRQLITVSKLQSRLMAKLITNGAAFRARSHASVLPADWRDAVSCPLLPARSSRW